jgi:hypothetical protein
MSSFGKAPRPAPMGAQQLRDFVRAARKRGYYGESFHSEVERAYRNISPDDIAHGLDWPDWFLCKEPDFDEEHGSWEYLIQTVDIEGEVLHLKITVDEKNKRFEVISKW